MELPKDEWTLVAEQPMYLQRQNVGEHAVAYVFSKDTPQSANHHAPNYVKLGSEDHYVLEPFSDPYEYRNECNRGFNVYAKSIYPDTGFLSVVKHPDQEE